MRVTPVWRVVLATTAFILGILGLVYGCGPTYKDTSYDPPPPQKQCGEYNQGDVRQTACPSGEDGTIVEQCSSEGWKEVSRNCQACNKASPDWDEIKTLIDGKCVKCHPGYSGFDVAASKAGAMEYRINLPAGDPKRMPPSPAPELSPEDKQKFADWQKAGTPKEAECEDGGDDLGAIFMDLDYIETEILNDLSRADGVFSPSVRYVITSHKYNIQDKSLADYGNAISKGINSVTFERDLTAASPIDLRKTIYRIDLESFDLNAADWNLIENAEPINFESFTTKGEVIKALTQTRKPWLHAESFLITAHDAPVYYELLDIPQTDEELLDILEVDYEQQLRDLDARFIGFNGSPISLNKNRLIARYESEEGYLWITYDTDLNNNAVEANLFQFPLLEEVGGQANFLFDASEWIFTLPNGLQGYALFDAAGNRADFAPLTIVADDQTPFNPEIRNSLSCFRCHNGLIESKDQIRDHVLRNGSEFTRDDVELIELLYETEGANAALFTQDNAFYAQSLAGLGFSENSDGLNALTDQLRRDHNAESVAALLLLTEQEFLYRLEQSGDARAAVGQLLTGGTVTFDTLVANLPIILDDLGIGFDELP